MRTLQEDHGPTTVEHSKSKPSRTDSDAELDGDNKHPTTCGRPQLPPTMTRNSRTLSTGNSELIASRCLSPETSAASSFSARANR